MQHNVDQCIHTDVSQDDFDSSGIVNISSIPLTVFKRRLHTATCNWDEMNHLSGIIGNDSLRSRQGAISEQG